MVVEMGSGMGAGILSTVGVPATQDEVDVMREIIGWAVAMMVLSGYAGPGSDRFKEGLVKLKVLEEARGCTVENPRGSTAVKPALQFLLTRIGSWTHARWDQHLRDEFGDEKAAQAIQWIEAMFDVKAFARQAALPGGDGS